MNFSEIVGTDEWKMVYTALLKKWKYEFRSAATAVEREKHLQHKAKFEMIEEIMSMPLEKLKGESADLYRGKIQRDQDKIMKERFEGTHAA